MKAYGLFLFYWQHFIVFSLDNWSRDEDQRYIRSKRLAQESPTDPCQDIFTNCSQKLCEIKPYTYLPNCRLTCNNCDGCKCFDTTDTTGGPLCNTSVILASSAICTTPQMYKRCPLKCNRCKDIQQSSCLTTTIRPTTTAPLCKDIYPASKCTNDDFKLNPYDSYKFCKRSFNNCDGCTCADSDYPLGSGGNCKTLPPSFCKSEAAWKKCPLKCNKCSEILSPGCPSCVDTPVGNATCSLTACDQTPGLFYPMCKKTCNNCDGCKCKDSTTELCSAFRKDGACSKQKAFLYCPVTCNLCSKVREAANTLYCSS